MPVAAPVVRWVKVQTVGFGVGALMCDMLTSFTKDEWIIATKSGRDPGDEESVRVRRIRPVVRALDVEQSTDDSAGQG